MTETRFDRRRQQTRQQLKQAALELLIERGYDAVHVQNITDRLDLARGTFYLHFRDKQEIYATIIHETFEAFEALDGPVLDGLSLPQRDLLGFMGFFAFIQQQGGIMRLIMTGNGNADLIEYVAQYTAKRALERLGQGNIYPDVPVEVSAQFMAGALMRVTRWWLQHPEQYTPAQMATLFYRLLHHAAPDDIF
jgi:AcrR family transcriptional regulator